MTAQILDGRVLAQKIKADLGQQVIRFKEQIGEVPRLVNLMIGDDPGGCAYANSQQRVAQQLGIDYQLVNFPADIHQDDFILKLKQYNDDPAVNGIMMHKPFPAQVNYREVANHLNTLKDLEGVNAANVGKMLLGETEMIPCTPAAVMEHLKTCVPDLRGKEAVIVGASDIVGKPLSLLLLRQMATVTVCHIGTSEAGRLEDHVGRAEILIVAVGRAGLIRGEWLKPQAVVIDVGINQVNDRIVGDVVFDSAFERASWITPVPGGVGPVTVVMLMRNGVAAFKNQKSL